jgi:hypothetical protein
LCHSQRYTRLEVESAIHPQQRIYCPHKDCSALLLMPDEKELCVGASVCPECQRLLCANCLIPGWHEVRASCEAPFRLKHLLGHRTRQPTLIPTATQRNTQGFTCEAFQALPPHLRSADDAALLTLSAERHWQRCPTCGHMIEHIGGCNHMTCRCGTEFYLRY